MTDFFDDEPEAVPRKEQLADLEKMINQAITLSAEMQVKEKELNELKSKQQKLMHNDIPDAMTVAGVMKFTTKTGLKIEIKEFIDGSLPKKDLERRATAMQWLIENGGADIIKSNITIPFARGAHNFKEEVKGELKGLGADFIEVEDVHHSTLQAFAREKISKGEPVPLEMLGLYAGRKATIKKEDK